VKISVSHMKDVSSIRYVQMCPNVTEVLLNLKWQSLIPVRGLAINSSCIITSSGFHQITLDGEGSFLSHVKDFMNFVGYLMLSSGTT
jgi:hypothetical protein